MGVFRYRTGNEDHLFGVGNMVLQFLHGAGTHYQENIAYQLLSGSQFIGVNGAYFYSASKYKTQVPGQVAY